VITALWPLELAPGGTFEASMSIEVSDLHA
jgi:hypothetical protein